MISLFKKKWTSIVFLSLTLFIFSFSLVFAINSISDGWRVDSGTTMQVTDASWTCHKITNSSSTPCFVPTKTLAEWNAFASHLPSGVSNGSCQTCGWYTCCSGPADPLGCLMCMFGGGGSACAGACADYCESCYMCY